MGQEIERKFLIAKPDWKADADAGTTIKQGFLNTDKDRTVRIRIYGNRAFLTIKGKTVGMSKQEFEYEIPMADAEKLIKLCHKPLIEKTRYIVLHEGLAWEIDIFDEDNEGLEIAEVELKSEEQKVALPTWLGEEVTHDFSYYNSNLSKRPYKSWKK